jgi:hypothetical protein
MLGHLFRTDSARTPQILWTVRVLDKDQVCVHVLLNRQSVSELSPNRIRANQVDCMDSWTKHGQTPYGLHTA